MKASTDRPTLARLTLAAGALAAAAALAGCVVAPVPGTVYSDPYGYPSTPATVYAPMAPPAPYYEVQPALPYPGAIWINGYWNWSGNRHHWVPGRYERPRPATAGNHTAGTARRAAAGTCRAAAGCAERVNATARMHQRICAKQGSSARLSSASSY